MYVLLLMVYYKYFKFKNLFFFFPQVKWSVYWQYLRAIRCLPLCIILVAHIGWQVCAVSANVWLSEWGNDKPMNGSEGFKQRNYRLGVYGAFGFGEGM